jgi:hypothetical protein
MHQLELSSVQIGAPKQDGNQRWININIEAQNNSIHTTYYLISSARALQYDGAKHTLLVSFSEPDVDPEIPFRHKFSPQQVTLGPKESVSLEVSIPLILNVLRRSVEFGVDLALVDITGLRHVLVRLDYSDVPYRPLGSASATERIQHLRKWGTTVEKRFRATIPATGGAPMV